ncbi:hypothetical protein D3C72_1845540 [compost metagenome]
MGVVSAQQNHVDSSRERHNDESHTNNPDPRGAGHRACRQRMQADGIACRCGQAARRSRCRSDRSPGNTVRRVQRLADRRQAS